MMDFELINGNGSSKGNLYFKGEYIDGIWNGKVKEFSKGGKLIFEGEYLNGKRNGKGKEYFDLLFQ